MNWRDHTNPMTVAERAEAANDEFWSPNHAFLLSSWMTTFGHVCANAELERHRATQQSLAKEVEFRLTVEAERDALKAERDKLAKELVNCEQVAARRMADAVSVREASLAESKAEAEYRRVRQCVTEGERDAVRAERDALQHELQIVIANRDELATRRAELLVERAVLESERDAFKAERDRWRGVVVDVAKACGSWPVSDETLMTAGEYVRSLMNRIRVLEDRDKRRAELLALGIQFRTLVDASADMAARLRVAREELLRAANIATSSTEADAAERLKDGGQS